MDYIERSVRSIKGIGPKKGQLLARIGIHTFRDALYYFPKDYEEHYGVIAATEAKDGEMVSLCLRLQGRPEVVRKRKNMSITKWMAYDKSGSVACVWFNQPYRVSQYRKGLLYYVYGKAVLRSGQLQIQNPRIEEFNEDVHNRFRMKPIYPLTEGLTQKILRDLICHVLERIGDEFEEDLPQIVRDKYDLEDRCYALKNIHFPEDKESLDRSRRRLVFEELFDIQMAMYALRKEVKDGKGPVIELNTNTITDFIGALPFQLTKAQNRALKEVAGDLKRRSPMNRLVYGDVGSGKTVVAAFALYSAFIGGYQGAVMAPTEVLARQHYKTLRNLLQPWGLEIGLLTGSMPKKDKNEVMIALKEGKLDIIIGTHALLGNNVVFKRLGLVITDEQHRFGVGQRAILEQKVMCRPHVLVMSATPIPRTLALIFYGDLDISVIDELPPGRIPVKTYHVPTVMRDRIYAFIRKQAKYGRQSYLIYPLIEDSDTIQAQSAVTMYEDLKGEPLSGLRLGLLHGRMDAEEKTRVMDEFQRGTIDVLISTTVIEVGVDIPNANLMIVEDADRFGLAQLHQLRGRVGRGNIQAYCILVSDARNNYARERMATMVKTNNGFEISQKDLELRGPGEFLGSRQHGLPEFKISNLARDTKILAEVQTACNWIIKSEDLSLKQSILERAFAKFDRCIQKITFN